MIPAWAPSNEFFVNMITKKKRIGNYHMNYLCYFIVEIEALSQIDSYRLATFLKIIKKENGCHDSTSGNPHLLFDSFSSFIRKKVFLLIQSYF